MSDNLYIKPCPFCGDEAEEAHSDRDYEREYVRCTGCRAQTDYSYHIALAADWWNQRICVLEKKIQGIKL